MRADKLILCLPGGGALGAIQAACLARIEERLVAAGAIHNSIAEVLALVVSTSVGTINGGVLASGRLNARRLLVMFLDALPVIFNRTGLLPKYSQRSYDSIVNRVLGENIKLRDCVVPFAATTVNEVDEDEPILMESWAGPYRNDRLLDVMKRSSAAPVFFGGIVDEKAMAVYLDGGTGALNCPLLPTLNEAMKFNWFDGTQRVHIVNVGTGSRHYGVPWKRARRRFLKNLRELLCFSDPDDGGLARKQMTKLQVSWCESMDRTFPWFSFENLDVPLSPAVDRLDNIRDTALFVGLGFELGDKADLRPWGA